MARTVILYALALAMAVAALQRLEHRHAMRAFSTQLYVAVAAAFVALGLWAGASADSAAGEALKGDALWD